MTSPRGKKGNKEDDNNEEVKLKDLVFSLKASLDKFTISINSKMDKLTDSISNIKAENSKTTKTLDLLALNINSREQQHRNSSLRISGLTLDDEVGRDAFRTSHAVYNKLLSPILKYAIKDVIIEKVPPMIELIKYCHTLPNKKSPINKPAIIVRFQSRLLRSLILKYKKVFFNDTSSDGIYISEDLTKLNYQLLRDTKSLPTTKSAWTTGGKVFYTTVDQPDIRIKL